MTRPRSDNPVLRKPFVTGGGGQLGSAFAALLGRDVVAVRRQVDVTDTSAVARVLDDRQVSLIINCAAFTGVDAAEQRPEAAHAVNATAVAGLTQLARERQIPLVTFSTDYVFDGEADVPYTETDTPDPMNAYGRSKLAGERAALGYSSSLVIRSSWLVSGNRPNFVATMLDLVSAARPVRVVDDQHGSPTIAVDLARQTLRAVDRGVTGLLHVTNRGATTWFRLAVTAVELAGLDRSLVSPCTTQEYPTRAHRPRYSVLASERDLGLEPMRSWEEALPQVVAELRSTRRAAGSAAPDHRAP